MVRQSDMAPHDQSEGAGGAGILALALLRVVGLFVLTNKVDREENSWISQ